MKTLAALGLVLAVLVGCHTSPSASVPEGETLASPTAAATFHADIAFTEEERAVIAKAAQTWRQQTGGLADIAVVYDLDFDSVQNLTAHGHDHVMVRRTSDEILVMLMDLQAGMPGAILGWTTSDGIHNMQHEPVRMSLVVDRMGSFKGELLQVVIHEMGHALGIGHLDSPTAIMYPSVDPDRHNCLKIPDLVAFCAANVCPSDVHLAACQ